MPDLLHVASVPVPGGKLTREKYKEVETFLEEWKADVLKAAREHPAKSYDAGVAQVQAFAKLLGNLGMTSVPPDTLGSGPTSAEAVEWVRTYTYRELDDSLNVYIGKVKDAILYGLRGAWNPVTLASTLYKATKDAEVNWRTIARTEMVRAMSAGRLQATEEMGYDKVWCPPHAGACGTCRRLIENKVFPIEQVRDATNFGRKMRDWIACIPLHPHCRHAWLPYEPEVVEEAMQHYAQLEAAGLTDDDTLDAMFDTSGQLKPEYANDPRLRAIKTRRDADDVYFQVLRSSIEVVKTRRVTFGDELRNRLRPRGPRRVVLTRDELEDLRVDDLYQRDLDQGKVESMAARIAAGEQLDPAEVNDREDGSRYIMDGQHRVAAAKRADSGLDVDLYHQLPWEEEHRRCREAMGEEVPRPEVGKGFFDSEQAGRDPAFWDGMALRDDVHQRIAQWCNRVLGRGWHRWARLYLTGGATSRQWLSHPERDSDVDLQIVVDYPALRKQRKGWATLNDHDLHWALVATVKAGLAADTEVVPGIRLDAFVRPEHTVERFERDARLSGQAVFDLLDHRWITQGYDGPEGELYGEPWLEGIGAAESLEHPDWLDDARELVGMLTAYLDEFTADPTQENLDRLHGAYTILHDARKNGYADDGEESRGNFLWQYAVNFGPLMQVKHLLIDTELGKVWPDYTWTVEKADGLQHIGYAHPITMRPLCHDCAPKAGDVGAMQRMMKKPGNAVAVNCSECKKPLAPRGDVGKMSPAPAPGTGVEHWITVHPHGEEEPGQPVLVRNNSDGSMTVIGGAGGSLNYLRLDSKRRIDDKKSKVQGVKGKPLTAEQPITEEERAHQEKEFEERKEQARALIEKVQGQKKDLQGRLRDYVTGEVGYDIGHKKIKHGDGREEVAETSFMEQAKQLRKLRQAALHTLAYGEISRKDANDSPYLIEEKHGDYEGMEDKPKDADEPEIHEPADDNGDTQEPPEDVDSTPEEELQRARQSLARLPGLTKEQAEAIMELDRQIARLSKQQSKARKVLRAGGEHADSLALDWRDADVKKDVAKAVEGQVRTDVARELVETSEGKDNPAKKRYGDALQQGAYDSIDAFTHAVLGVSAITPEVGRLLGAAGTAQLAAHAIRKKAAADGLDVQKALDALDAHTQKQEMEVATVALARARKAADTAVQMREERKLSQAGESLWLQTMTYSYEQKKMGEAARLLGMAIGGMEATSALKVALSAPSEKVKVTGFESAASIKALAQKASVQITDKDITRVGAGNYTLSLEPERIENLLHFDQPPNTALRDRLRKLRTPGQLQREVENAQRTPGMADTLDESQARGKLVLTTTAQEGGGCVLAFAPGRGKTHTALAAALQRMNDEHVPQGQGNTWIVCPTTAMAEWAGTIANNTTRGVQMVGKEFEHLGGGVIQSKQQNHKTEGQLANPTDFNIVGIEHLQSLLKKHPELADQVKAARVITDESQKIKNPGKQGEEDRQKRNRWQTLNEFAKHTTERWALSGTTVEKRLRDLGAQYRWANPNKSMTPAAMEAKYGSSRRGGALGQTEHILGQDQIRQFREGLDEGLYQLGADDKNLPEREPDQEHKVTLDDEHQQALQETVKSINEQRAEAKERGQKGISGIDAERIMRQALYERPHNAMAREVSSIIDNMPDVDYEGDENGQNGGHYAGKAIVFSQFVRQLDHVVDELQGGDAKVFYAHGGMSSEENDKQLKDFIAHKGRAVLVSSDKNSTARSLQFGKNKGRFQHGATTMVHYSQPDNNATIQQREARIRRKGSAVPVQYHTLNAGTPAEVRQKDRLEEERRTQDLAGNSEQLVGGKETLRHRLERAGAVA